MMVIPLLIGATCIMQKYIEVAKILVGCVYVVLVHHAQFQINRKKEMDKTVFKFKGIAYSEK